VEAGQGMFCYRCDGKEPPSDNLGCLLSSFERRKVHVPWVERERKELPVSPPNHDEGIQQLVADFQKGY
jgi:hypothetical protein